MRMLPNYYNRIFVLLRPFVDAYCPEFYAFIPPPNVWKCYIILVYMYTGAFGVFRLIRSIVRKLFVVILLLLYISAHYTSILSYKQLLVMYLVSQCLCLFHPPITGTINWFNLLKLGSSGQRATLC